MERCGLCRRMMIVCLSLVPCILPMSIVLWVGVVVVTWSGCV